MLNDSPFDDSLYHTKGIDAQDEVLLIAMTVVTERDAGTFNEWLAKALAINADNQPRMVGLLMDAAVLIDRDEFSTMAGEFLASDRFKKFVDTAKVRRN